MKKFSAIVFFFILSIFLILIALQFHPRIFTRELEFLANRYTKEILNGSVKIGHASLDTHFYVQLQDVRASLKTKEEKIPFQVRLVYSMQPITHLFLMKGIWFHFEALRPGTSKRVGTNGDIHIGLIPHPSYEVKAQVKELNLDELAWINHDNLDGASGNLLGEVLFHGAERQIPAFTLDLTNTEGGFLKSDLFNLLLQYIPEVGLRENVRELIRKGGLVHIDKGSVKAELIAPNRLKILLRLLILQYNVDLNLNLEIRTDEQDAFPELVKLAGLFHVRMK